LAVGNVIACYGSASAAAILAVTAMFCHVFHSCNNHVSNGQRAVLNFKRAFSNVDKREKMFAVSA
jgi:hypothetical protein